MWVSTVAAGEFAVKQSFNDLPLRNFRIQPYNLSHAIRAAVLFNQAKSLSTTADDRRPIIINDLKIIAQAAEEKIPFIVTEDENTLVRLAARLREKGGTAVGTLLLRDGFELPRTAESAQSELEL